MYGYLNADPSRLVLLRPLTPGSWDWVSNGCRFSAHWFADGKEYTVMVAGHDIHGLIDINDILSGIL